MFYDCLCDGEEELPGLSRKPVLHGLTRLHDAALHGLVGSRLGGSDGNDAAPCETTRAWSWHPMGPCDRLLRSVHRIPISASGCLR